MMKKFFVARFLANAASLIAAAGLLASCAARRPPEGSTEKGPLVTRWAKSVTPRNVHREHPNPQMERSHWQNLNGLWDYAIAKKEEPRPVSFAGKILVPFPIESALSGVMKKVGPENRLWYRRTFSIPRGWRSGQVVLHFGAVDWEATVWVNGREAGTHRGGYDSFKFNIGDFLVDAKEQEIVVAVWDPTDAGPQPRGKQVRNPESIWYTPVSGIWQTPWLERVSPTHLRSLKITPDVDRQRITVSAEVERPETGLTLHAVVANGNRSVAAGEAPVNKTSATNATATVTLSIPQPKLWSPDSPHLYDLRLSLRRAGKTLDEVKSYCGLRKIALSKDVKGTLRLFLNNAPLFQFGPLDQGWWPDGLYTAPSDEALKYDVQVTKELGFNMARKHVKIEPHRWYYWCDKLGLLVWQDMPSGDKYIRPIDPDIQRTPESARQFEVELKAMIDGLHNHPSIVMWVPFNEGWGQYDTLRIAEWIKKYDPTRLVNHASGWTDRGGGDVNDIHIYPGPGAPKIEEKRAGVLGEFGGLGLPVRGHTWQNEKNWGYRSFTNVADLTRAYENLIRKLRPLIGEPGLAAAVYTQTSDVEIEVNGLLTYDRAMIKMGKDRLAAINRKVYLRPPLPPKITPLVRTSQEQAAEWRYTITRPPAHWASPAFDDSGWERGRGGFGTAGTPGAQIGTEWKTSDIWLRREFEIPRELKSKNLQLLVHHDEDAVIYVNGEQVGHYTGYISSYELMLPARQLEKLLKPGKNILAVHCRQTGGGQYIDVGIVDVEERELTE